MTNEIQSDEPENQNEMVESQVEERQPDSPASQGRSKIGKRWLWVLLGVVASFMVLGIGAAAGGAAAYIWLRDEIPAVRAAGDPEVIFKTTSAIFNFCTSSF